MGCLEINSAVKGELGRGSSAPLLYVLGGDLLRSAVNDMLAAGQLQLPIITGDPDFPII
jgi:hypothetical protein